MPGLLQSPEGNFGSVKVIYALVAEFLGTMVGGEVAADPVTSRLYYVASYDIGAPFARSFLLSLGLRLRGQRRQKAAKGETTGHPGKLMLLSARLKMAGAAILSAKS